jgi:DNA-binding transcriptional LysR family regulator
MDARRMLTFREVARNRSFSRAAAALSLTQPAVSQQVAALERVLGVPLLVRGPGGPVPTEAGDLLLAHADAVAERLALADTQLAELADAARHHLRLGAFPSAMATLVPDAIQALQDRDPAVRVDVTEGTGAALAAAVARGELHLALVFEDARTAVDPGGARRELLFEERFVVALSPAHPLAGRQRIRLADVAGERWTAPSRSGLVARAIRDAGVEPEIPYVTSDPLAIRRLVASGLAVALMPRLLAGTMTGIATVEVADSPARRVEVLTPEGRRHPLVEPFVAALPRD